MTAFIEAASPHVMNTYGRLPIALSHGKGCRVWDVNGKEYLDALAGLGGVLWGLYQQSVVPQMGAQVNVLIFIVIIIGGLGSTLGALVGAVLVGLVANYTGFVAPKVALFSNILLMGVVLVWRPQGVYPVANR